MKMIAASDRRLIYPQMGGMGMMLTDYDMFEIYEDADKQLEIAEKIEETFPTDFIYPVDFGTIFQYTLGFAQKRPKRDFPSTIEHPLKTREDIADSPIINVKEDGLFPEYFKAMKRIAQKIQKPQMIACVGPLTLACELAGLEYVLKATVKDKEFVAQLLQYSTKLIEDFVVEAIENGAFILQISEPIMSILRPAVYEKQVLTALQHIIAIINERAISALHVCGDTRKYLPIMVESGAQILSLDQVMKMKEVMQQIPSTIVAAGNLDPVEVMLQGSYQEVYQSASQLLREMRDYPNFMISFGCDCPIDTPIENIQAVVDAVNKETYKEEKK